MEVTGLARDVAGLPFPALSCDVASATQVREAARQVRRDGKPVQGLISAAGIASMNLAVTTPPETAQRIIEVNLLGTS